jgi:hypothetical protein
LFIIIIRMIIMGIFSFIKQCGILPFNIIYSVAVVKFSSV